MPEKEPLYFKEFRKHIDNKIETYEPAYFKEFRKHIDKRFDDADKKFATKDDLKSFATKDDLKKYSTKSDLELMEISFKQHMTDLAAGFRSDLKGIGDYVKSIDEKVTVMGKKVMDIDLKVTTMQGDIFFIKDELKEKTDKSETLDLKRRIIKLEAKSA